MSVRNRAQCLLNAFLPVLAIAAFIPSNVSGQTLPENTAATTIVSNVDEVSLDLVVRDKKNKPVLDLRPEDFSIVDGGSTVKISDLRLVSAQSTVARPITLLFDDLDLAASRNARNAAAKILKEIPLDGFAVSVLNVHGRMMLYQGFTQDRSLMSQAITRATEGEGAKAQIGVESEEKNLLATIRTGADQSGIRLTPGQRTLAQVTLAALEQSQRIVQEQHASPSLAALLALARAERKLPGRKVVIYFAQELRLNMGAGEILGSIIGTANRSSVSIYTIDANSMSEQTAQGLVTMMAMGGAMHAGAANQVSAPQAPTGPGSVPMHSMGDVSSPGMQTMVGTQLERFEGRAGNEKKSTLAEVAEGTGGVYIAAGENPRKPVQQMIKDLSTYYEASYIPPIKDYDGQFRPITVKAVRSGLKVRAKAGYYALPADDSSGVRAFEGPLLKVFGEQQLPQDLKFRSAILQLGELTTGYTNALVVEVPVAELNLRDDPNSNLYSLHIAIVAQIKNKAGQVVEHFSEDVPRHAALDAKPEALRSDVVTMQRHFIVDPGEYVLEAVALDENSGKAGAIRSNFLVSSRGSGPFLSELSLVRRLDPLPEETDDLEPLRYGDNKVIPNFSGRVVSGVKSVSLFSLIHADPEATEQPRLEMTVLRNNEPIAQVPLPLRNPNGSHVVPYMAAMQVSPLPPGDYQIVQTLTQGTHVVERSLTLRIDGPELASVTPPAYLGETAGGLEVAAVLDRPSTGAVRGLVITSLPPGSVPAPTADEVERIASAARTHALTYAKSLPNFVCLEVTNRSVDPSSSGNWKRRDTLAELLRYVDSQETRTMVEHNGERTTAQRNDLDSTWPLSVGEFGGLLNLVFKPTSKTAFEWKESASLGAGMVDVLTYRVDQANANIGLSDGTKTVAAGFHGLVYIDRATGGVRRITLQADNLPRDFSIHGATMTVDYDYVAIGAHDYLMPMRAAVSLRRGRKQTDLNEIAFRNYRRYASEVKIQFTP